MKQHFIVAFSFLLFINNIFTRIFTAPYFCKEISVKDKLSHAEMVTLITEIWFQSHLYCFILPATKALKTNQMSSFNYAMFQEGMRGVAAKGDITHSMTEEKGSLTWFEDTSKI